MARAAARLRGDGFGVSGVMGKAGELVEPDRSEKGPARPSDEVLLAELSDLARSRERGFLQFLSLAGAYQYRRLYRIVRRHVPAGAGVLDWGAGNGHFSYFLVRTGYRAVGFSFDPGVRADWLLDPGYQLVQGRPEEPVALPWGADTFDAVVSVGVLEHVRETGGSEAGSLSEIARVLKPGGAFIAYHFPNRTSWIDFVAARMPGKHHHRYRYTRGDIRRLTREAGLELLETRRYAILPRNEIHRLLGPLRHARWPAEAWDAADAVLGALLAPWCQNHYFVARKPRRPAP